MHASKIWFAASALSLCAAAVGVVGLVAAEETKGAPVPQKAIVHPFLDGLVGSWTSEAVMTGDGRETKGTGKATYVRGLGDSALIETYELTMPGPDGRPMVFRGHGVTKLSEDGKTATTWWFDNMSPEPVKISGPVTETTLEQSGDSRMGGRMTVTMRRTADGLTFELVETGHKMSEVYRRAK